MTIVQVRLDGPPDLTLAAGMPAYDLDDGLYVPLGDFAQQVDFAIEVDATAAHAEGWFLDQGRRFLLDLPGCEVVVDGARRRLDGTGVAAHDGDLYVRLDALERWFPWHLAFDRSRLILTVDSTEPLPVERELAREHRWRRLGAGGGDNEAENYPTAEVPYLWWDWPFVDLTVEGQSRWQEETREREDDARYKLVAAGDMLGMNAEVAVAGDDRQSVSDTVVTLGRTDPAGGLLGPLGAREYRFGDLGIPRDPLVGENTLGQGITVSSFPLDRPQEFDNIDFRGELPIGWDAELYHNGELVAFQSGSDGSRYDFTSVPLHFGLNRFRIVLHGPQGQVRERTVQRIIGQGMVRPGRQHYRLTALEEDDAPVLPEGDRMTRFKGAYELGVTDSLSLGAGVERLTLADGVHDYARLGVRTAGPGFFATLEGARERDATDETDGRAVYGLLSTALGPVSVSLETARFAEFESERTLDASLGLLQRRSRLRLDARGRPMSAAWALYFGTELGRERWSRGEIADGSLRLSASGARWSLTDVIEGRRQRLDGAEPRWTAFNSVLLSGRAGDVSLRGRIRHELRPLKRLRDASVNSTWYLGKRMTGRLGIEHRFMDDVTSARGGLTWRFPWGALGTSLDVADDGNVTARVSLSTGLMRNPNERDWLASARPRTDSGAMAIEVFRDENANGVRDPGEPPMEGVEVGVRRTGATGVTDATGSTLLSDLPVHRELALYLGDSSLDDPFLMTRHGGRRVTLRPGRTARVALPVAPAGSFEGRVYALDSGDAEPAAGVRVSLMNLDGGIVARTETGYDGYYYFDKLPPGYYRLRTEPPDGASGSPGRLIVPFQDGAEFMSSVDLYIGSTGGRAGRDDAPAASDAGGAGEFRTGAWLLAQDPSTYTIQIMAASSENTVQGYIRRHGIGDRGAYYRSSWQGGPWYPVVLGVHDDRAAAEAALRRLPEALRTADPWVRPIGTIQDEIRRERR